MILNRNIFESGIKHHKPTNFVKKKFLVESGVKHQTLTIELILNVPSDYTNAMPS